MPARSIAEQQLCGSDLKKKRAGEKTTTGMTEEQLEHCASTSHAGLPKRKTPKKKTRAKKKAKRKAKRKT